MKRANSNARQLAIIAVCAMVVWLAFKLPMPAPKTQPTRPPELLPIADAKPTWDGAYPFLVVKVISSDSKHYRFEVGISNIKPTVRHDSAVNEFQVDLHSGLFVLRQTDLFVADVAPLVLTRTYRPWSLYARAFGVGANHPYDICPTGTRFPYTYQDLNLEDDRQIHFERISQGTSFSDAIFRHSETSSEFFGARNAWNGNGWTLDLADGRRFLFPEAYNAKSYAQGAATDISDAAGNHIRLKRDAGRNLEQLESPSGRFINLQYDAANRIIAASDDSGHVRRYDYDSSGHLETITDGSHLLFRFRYESLLLERGYDSFLMTRIEDGNGTVLLHNTFADGSGVSAQELGDGKIIRYEYLFNRRHEIIETVVTLPGGGQQRFLFENEKPVVRK
jgi:YD repeat-containing protein